MSGHIFFLVLSDWGEWEVFYFKSKSPLAVKSLNLLENTVILTCLFHHQHTVKNKIVYLPIVARLNCGMSPADATGRWEEFGTGLVGVYKKDWDNFHGMFVSLVWSFFQSLVAIS